MRDRTGAIANGWRYSTMANNKRKKGSREVKPKLGPLPKILGKGAAHRDRTKYTRKQKHGSAQQDTPE